MNLVRKARFIEPGWLIQQSRRKRFNVKGSPQKHYIEADFSLLESQTSYRFWISRQALCLPKIAGRTNLAEEPCVLISIIVKLSLFL